MLTDVVIANKSYTKLNVAKGKTVDDIAIRVIKQDCPDFLLPVRTMEIDGELELRYELMGGVRLCYSAMKMSKREFVILLRNMLVPFRDCGDWFLDYHNILMDTNYIMVDGAGQSVRYVYIPVAEYARPDTEIIEFFCDIILKVEIEDDARYAMNLLRVLKTDNANLMTLLEYISTDIQTEEKESAKAPAAQVMPSVNEEQPHHTEAVSNKKAFYVQAERPKNQTSGQANAESGNEAVKQEQKEFGRQDVGMQLMGNLFGEEEEPSGKSKKEKAPKASKQPKPPKQPKPAKEKKEKKEGGLFDRFKGKSKQNGAEENAGSAGHFEALYDHSPVQPQYAGQNQMQDARQDYGSYMDGNVTILADGNVTILADEKVHDNNILRLSLEDSAGCSCPKYIEVNLQKGSATVGRYDQNGQPQSDYNFDASLSFISRRHFRVEKDGEQWRIIDIGSKNGTIVNGERLLPNMAYPLCMGDRIMISGQNRLTYRVD